MGKHFEHRLVLCSVCQRTLLWEFALWYCTFQSLWISEGERDKFKWGNFGRNLSVASNRFSFLQSLWWRKHILLFLCPFYVLTPLCIVEMLLSSTDVKHAKIILKNNCESEGLEGTNTWFTALLSLFVFTMGSSNRPDYIPKHCLTKKEAFLSSGLEILDTGLSCLS